MKGLSGRQRDYLTAGLLFAATLCIRIPFRSHILTNVDSVNFALSLERYNVVEGQPHPPGDFLYVGAAKAFELIFRDATTALVALSIFAAAAGVAALFLLGRHMFDYATGLAAGILLLCSPVAWYYSSVALTYEVSMVLVIGCVWLLYDMIFLRRHAIAAAALLAVAGGFRIDTLVFLLPLYIWAALRVPRRQALASWAAMAGLTLAWALPFLLLLPGLQGYIDVFRVQIPSATSVEAAGWDAFMNNLIFVLHADMWLYGVAFTSILFLGLLLADRDKRDFFLLAVPLPAIIFFCLGHFSQYGYLLVFSAPLLLLGGRVLVRVANLLAAPLRNALPGNGLAVVLTPLLALVFAGNTYLFFHGGHVYLPTLFTHENISEAFGHYTEPVLLDYELETQEMIETVHRFSPEDTLIVSVEPHDSFSWRKMMYYFPEYRVVGIGSGLSSGIYFDAYQHFAPDFLERRGRLGPWKTLHFDVTVDRQYNNILIFGVADGQVPTTELTPVQPSPTGNRAYLGRLENKVDVIRVGSYRIHQ